MVASLSVGMTRYDFVHGEVMPFLFFVFTFLDNCR